MIVHRSDPLPTPPRIAIVDDHPILRRGVRLLLSEDFPGARFGESANSQEAIDTMQRSTWDLVLLDINMPDRSGLELLRDLKRMWPQIPALILSGYDEEEYAVPCLRLGAAGYVAKRSAADELPRAVRQALAGHKYVTAAVAQRLATGVSKAVEKMLSAREQQVLQHVAEGRSGREIALLLGVGEKTVATYRARIAAKLGISTNVELTRHAMKHGLVR